MVNSASANFPAISINSGTSPGKFSGLVSSGLNTIAGNSHSNTAFNAMQASQLRNWQEQMQAQTMEFNASEAAKNRDWQKMMSDTAHQREIADLKAAGLNPILSASGGNGASVTSGSSASVSTPSGAKGEADTSANSAIVGLLSSFISNMTALENQRNSAQNNLAVADKYNAMSKYVAELNSLTSQEVAKISGSYGLESARTSAFAAMQNAVTSAEASKAVAATHAAASNYSARKNSATSIYNNKATLENAKKIAEMNIDKDKYLAKNYPNTYASLMNTQIAELVSNLSDAGLLGPINAANNPFNKGPFKD